VDVVIDGLSETFPDQKAGFNERGKAYQKEIQDLHQWAQGRVNSLPEEKRVLVTSHDAFNYTGKAYGLEVVGVQGISTEAEPSLAAVSQTVDFIKERRIKAIFVESSVSPDVIKRVSEDANVTIGGELFSDAMGIPGTMETFDGETYDVGTYIGMLKHNINTAVSSLEKE
ncbi:MAG: zinc ABC transporter substrate-binding protein, partial [Verrucomicrobiota bacterium]